MYGVFLNNVFDKIEEMCENIYFVIDTERGNKILKFKDNNKIIL